MRTEAEIRAEIGRIQTMRVNYERDFRWRSNQRYYIKGLRWALEKSELGENSEE